MVIEAIGGVWGDETTDSWGNRFGNRNGTEMEHGIGKEIFSNAKMDDF